jgi:hypothetical protein
MNHFITVRIVHLNSYHTDIMEVHRKGVGLSLRHLRFPIPGEKKSVAVKIESTIYQMQAVVTASAISAANVISKTNGLHTEIPRSQRYTEKALVFLRVNSVSPDLRAKKNHLPLMP